MNNRPAQLLRYVEWEQSGFWYCNDTSDLCSVRALWATPAHMLNISPAEYVKLLVTRFKPDVIKYSEEHDVLVFCWRNINNMRLFKNWINAEARKRKYII